MVAVKSGHPLFTTDHFDLVVRDPRWFDQVAPGIEGSAGEGLRNLRPAWALADLLHHSGWEHSGLSPDDIEWAEAAGAERDWRAARKVFGLVPVALRDMGVASRAHRPRMPAGRQRRSLRRDAKT